MNGNQRSGVWGIVGAGSAVVWLYSEQNTSFSTVDVYVIFYSLSSFGLGQGILNVSVN